MIIAEVLCLQELVKICLHEVLYYIYIFHLLNGWCPDDVIDADDVLMSEAQ